MLWYGRGLTWKGIDKEGGWDGRGLICTRNTDFIEHSNE